MCLGRARLDTRDEARADPHRLGAPRQVRSEAAPVVHRARADDVDGLAVERRLVALDGVHASGNEDGRGHVARVTAALAGLRADEVDAGFKCFGDVFRVADHLEYPRKHA